MIMLPFEGKRWLGRRPAFEDQDQKYLYDQKYLELYKETACVISRMVLWVGHDQKYL